VPPFLLPCAALAGAVLGFAGLPPTPPEDLGPDETREAAIAAGQQHEYRVVLQPGQYVKATADQRGIDLTLVAYDPQGVKLAETNFRATADGGEWLTLVAEEPGPYRLVVRPSLSDAAAGRYELKLTGPHEASAAERSRALADRAAERGGRLWKAGTTRSLEDALPHLEEAAGHYAAASLRGLEARALTDMGAIHRQLGRPDKAFVYYARALPLRRAAGDTRGEGVTLSSMGLAQQYVGRFQEARETLDQALALWRRLGDLQGQSLALDYLALLYRRLGDYQRAIDTLREALLISRQGRARVQEASALQGLGRVYASLGEGELALRYLTQALAAARAIDDRKAQGITLLNLSRVHEEEGRLDQALAMLEDCVAVAVPLADKDAEIGCRQARALQWAGRGMGEEALREADTARALAEAAGYRVAEASALYALATIRHGRGEYAAARDLVTRSLALFEAAGDTTNVAAARHLLGKVLRDLGDLEGALRETTAALAVREAARGTVASPDLRATYVAHGHELYDDHVDILMRLHARRPGDGHAAAAVEAVERGRARALVEMLAEGRLDARGAVDAGQRRREREVHARIAWMQGRLQELRRTPGPAGAEAAGLEAQLETAERERQELEDEIRRANPRYAQVRYPQPLTLPAMQGALDSETSLLLYSLGADAAYVFAVSRDRLDAQRLGATAEIRREVARLREAVRQPSRLRRSAYLQSAHRLYELIVAPAAAALADKRRLLIAPDGVLDYLPFEALLTTPPSPAAGDHEQPYLLRRWTVSYVPSATALAALRDGRRDAAASTGPAPALVVFADPVLGGTGPPASAAADEDSAAGALRGMLDDVGLQSLPPLPESRREAQGLGRLFPPGQVALYLGDSATEENLKGAPAVATARRLHFATHALVSSRRPARSALVLSRPAGSPEDGLFQAFELSTLSLRADLVVLSACETGLGRELRGEGFIGLTRSFLHAGAASVVASLWQVADRSTADLMIGFHGQLDRSPRKSDALRRAKLQLIGKGRFAHPYYWAPFVLVGEP
jgi:CHAT domain-containing protein